MAADGVPLAHLTDRLDTWCRDCRATSNLRELAECSRKTVMETSHSRALAEGFLGRACRVRSRGAWARMR